MAGRPLPWMVGPPVPARGPQPRATGAPAWRTRAAGSTPEPRPRRPPRPGGAVARTALDVYLNDHLAGSTMGLDLARRLASQGEGTPVGKVMGAIASEIERDRETLERL